MMSLLIALPEWGHMKVAAGRLAEVGSDMSSQSVANTIWAMGTLGFYHNRALSTLAAQVKGERAVLPFPCYSKQVQAG